jgi:hypothetical protein
MLMDGLIVKVGLGEARRKICDAECRREEALWVWVSLINFSPKVHKKT